MVNNMILSTYFLRNQRNVLLYTATFLAFQYLIFLHSLYKSFVLLFLISDNDFLR